jgi:CBS domain containing-hemolysin-like protein
MDTFLLSGIILSVFFSFFFASMESAYQSSGSLTKFTDDKSKKIPQRIISFFARHKSWFIGTTFMGGSVALVSMTVFSFLWISPRLHLRLPENFNSNLTIAFIAVLFSATLAIISEIILPRWIPARDPHRYMVALAIPFGLSFGLLSPLVIPTVGIVRYVMARIYKTRQEAELQFPGRANLKHLIQATQSRPEAEDIAMNKKILRNALEFKTVKIKECMIPRTEIVAVEINETIAELRNIFVKTGHSKVIIYRQSLDEVIGYCHSSSLFKMPALIQDILTPIIIVAETTLANDLMVRFITERKSLAVVVDEFGGTSGIVSMEDVIEEIFGEIEDEHDEEDQLLVEQKLYENTYLISARLEIDYLNDTYHWGLPTGEYETLGGLILAYAEDFPKQGQTIHVPPFTFIIQTTGQNRIKTVLVELENKPKHRP